MLAKDKARLLQFYGTRKDKFGLGSLGALSWNSKETQEIRFKVLSEISSNLNNKIVLDLGSGFGDFYDYLDDQFDLKKYIGIDLERDFVEYSKKNHDSSKTEFIEADFLEMNELPSNDYSFISGSLNFKIKNAKEVYFELIRKAFESSKKGLAFNMLDSRFHIETDEFITYEPEEVMEYCLSITTEVELIRGYLSYDFTLYLRQPLAQ